MVPQCGVRLHSSAHRDTAATCALSQGVATAPRRGWPSPPLSKFRCKVGGPLYLYRERSYSISSALHYCKHIMVSPELQVQHSLWSLCAYRIRGVRTMSMTHTCQDCLNYGRDEDSAKSTYTIFALLSRPCSSSAVHAMACAACAKATTGSSISQPRGDRRWVSGVLCKGGWVCCQPR